MKSAQRRPVRRSSYRRPAPRRSGRGSYGHGSSHRGGFARFVLGALVIFGVLVAVKLAFDGGQGLDGDPGRVHDKDRTWTQSTKQWDYDLRVERADGSRYWIDVSYDIYDDCVRGARYPACGQDD